jgi:hypothetical protein
MKAIYLDHTHMTKHTKGRSQKADRKQAAKTDKQSWMTIELQVRSQTKARLEALAKRENTSVSEIASMIFEGKVNQQREMSESWNISYREITAPWRPRRWELADHRTGIRFSLNGRIRTTGTRVLPGHASKRP